MRKNVIIIILVILILGLSGYLVYDKLLVSTDNEESNNDKKLEGETFDLAEAKTIIDKYLNSDMRNIIERIEETNLDEETRLAMVLNSLESDVNYRCDELFENVGEYGDIGSTFYRMGWVCEQREDSQYTYSNVNEQYKKFFGSSENALKQNILYRYEAYAYSDIKNLYVSLQPMFGPILSNSYYYEVKEALTTNSELKIKIAYLTYKENALLDEKGISYEMDNIEYTVDTKDEIKQIYVQNEQKLPTLTFIFENENDNYVLKRVE